MQDLFLLFFVSCVFFFFVVEETVFLIVIKWLRNTSDNTLTNLFEWNVLYWKWSQKWISLEKHFNALNQQNSPTRSLLQWPHQFELQRDAKLPFFVLLLIPRSWSRMWACVRGCSKFIYDWKKDLIMFVITRRKAAISTIYASLKSVVCNCFWPLLWIS